MTAKSRSGSLLEKLYSRLAVPGTGANVQVNPEVICGKDVRDGVLTSEAGIVASIRNFKPDFIRVPEALGGPLQRIESEPAWTHLDASAVAPDWPEVGEFWRMAPAGSVLKIDHEGMVRLKFAAHPSSGFVLVNEHEIDLFHPNSPIPLVFECRGPIELKPLGKRNPKSRNFQVLLESVELQSSDFVPAGYSRVVRNRARPFRARPMEILRSLPEDAFMLDIGGGRRMLDDPRYFNMEFDLFEEADVYGDAQSLPFKDECIDFIHSTAVFEHLPEPAQAAKEIYRVLKPGGRAYIVAAFTQPVHSEPQHFYNATIFGLEHWFKDFEKRKVSYGGEFTETMMALAKAAAKGAPEERYQALRHQLSAIAKYVTEESYMYTAAETRIEVEKRA